MRKTGEECCYRKLFFSYSTDLAKATANTRILFTELCTTESGRCMDGFVVFTLICLDKNPGVHPISISEVLCRIIGKAVVQHLKSNITWQPTVYS